MSRQRLVPALAIGFLAALTLGGCSSGHPAHGVTPGPNASAAAAASAAASAVGGPSASPGSPGSTVGLAHSGGCHTADFAGHAGLATGAVHEYVSKPFAAGRLNSGGTAGARTAALASSYARHQLTLAVAAVKDCPTAKVLVGVTGQNVDFLGRLAAKLTSSTPPADLIRAADPLLADVASQAGRMNLKLVAKVPTPAQLHG